MELTKFCDLTLPALGQSSLEFYRLQRNSFSRAKLVTGERYVRAAVLLPLFIAGIVTRLSGRCTIPWPLLSVTQKLWKLRGNLLLTIGLSSIIAKWQEGSLISRNQPVQSLRNTLAVLANGISWINLAGSAFGFSLGALNPFVTVYGLAIWGTVATSDLVAQGGRGIRRRQTFCAGLAFGFFTSGLLQTLPKLVPVPNCLNLKSFGLLFSGFGSASAIASLSL
jgi:hypothetical protein